jgi:hypothetical protein
MKSVALTLALGLAIGLSLPMFANAADAPKGGVAVQAQATPATPAMKIDCAKAENKGHADCKVPATPAAPAKK